MLTFSLMNHTFEVPCEEDEKERLIEAATLLEEKLEQVSGLKGESKVLMVALNICYDYLKIKDDTIQYCERVDDELAQRMEETLKQN
ncbi:MAG TPA: cell division protein ZapA [Thiomicrospira sp.]|jgi:cell division protein ZapA|nr:cell division protein ZapA [Thiomicrospira sp.]